MRKTKNNYVPAEYGGYLFPKSCLPDIVEGDGGKVLKVNESETEAEWADCFPVILYGDAGKVLTGNESETGVEWAEGGSGGGGLLVKILDVNTDSYLDKTWNQIYSAVLAGSDVTIIDITGDTAYPNNIMIRLHQLYNIVSGVDGSGNQGYAVNIKIDGVTTTFFSRSPDGRLELLK